MGNDSDIYIFGVPKHTPFSRRPYVGILAVCLAFAFITTFLYSRVSDDSCKISEVPSIPSYYYLYDGQKIPKIVHYTYFGGRPFGFVNWLAVRSAVVTLKPDEIYFHYSEEPTGFWWQQIKPHVRMMKVKNVVSIFGNPVNVLAHKADITRLEVLKQYGGIYMDTDVGVLKPFDDLLNNSVVMGYQEENNVQFCNAIILSEQNSTFVNRWFDQYVTFNDSIWAFHSGVVSARLAHFYPNEIKTLNRTKLFYPDFYLNGLQDMHVWNRPELLQDSYTYHFWESAAWDFLKPIGPKYMMTHNTTFTTAFRHLIPKELQNRKQ